MDDRTFRERAASIARVPPELFEYQRWLAGERKRKAPRRGRDYLFAEPEPRFEPRKEDVVVPLGSLEVRRKGGQVRLHSPAAAASLELDGVSQDEATRLIAAIDGQRSLLEVGWEAEVEPVVLARFLRAAFGRLLLAPAAVVELERQLSGVEIVRFPCAPYGIDRPYWENMIALRRWFETQGADLGAPGRFASLLGELHVIALMGRSLRSFYKPASPVADRTVAPGSFFEEAVRLERTETMTIFLDGPRVNASFVGGRGYHDALYDSLGDPAALGPERSFEQDGLAWGELIHARSQKDDGPGPWFCPPRPIEPAHLGALQEDLQGALAAARAGRPALAARRAARFHQRFVRLHPFHCANQSLAMSLVNAVLAGSHGAGMPHLLLDHLALRLSTDAYQRLFARAVAAYVVVEPNPARRLSVLDERARASFDLIRGLAAADSSTARRRLVSAHPEAARNALVRD